MSGHKKNGQGFFTQDQIHVLHAAIIDAGLEPRSLLRELDPHVSAILDGNASTQSDYLLALLTGLNRLRLVDGSVPFRTVLKTAQLLVGPRVTSESLASSIELLDRHFPGKDPPPISSGPHGALEQLPAHLTAWLAQPPPKPLEPSTYVLRWLFLTALFFLSWEIALHCTFFSIHLFGKAVVTAYGAWPAALFALTSFAYAFVGYFRSLRLWATLLAPVVLSISVVPVAIVLRDVRLAASGLLVVFGGLFGVYALSCGLLACGKAKATMGVVGLFLLVAAATVRPSIGKTLAVLFIPEPLPEHPAEIVFPLFLLLVWLLIVFRLAQLTIRFGSEFPLISILAHRSTRL
jgi:hypothetical protein